MDIVLPASHQSSRPTSVDLSTEFCAEDGTTVRTTIKLVEFFDRTLIFVTNLNGRVGHVIEIAFPSLYQTLNAGFTGHRTEHFEMRTILGPDMDDYDLFVTRVGKVLVKHGMVTRPTWMMLGMESTKNIAYLRHIVERIDAHFDAAATKSSAQDNGLSAAYE